MSCTAWLFPPPQQHQDKDNEYIVVCHAAGTLRMGWQDADKVLPAGIQNYKDVYCTFSTLKLLVVLYNIV